MAGSCVVEADLSIEEGHWAERAVLATDHWSSSIDLDDRQAGRQFKLKFKFFKSETKFNILCLF
jgi:hypothetical protein